MISMIACPPCWPQYCIAVIWSEVEWKSRNACKWYDQKFKTEKVVVVPKSEEGGGELHIKYCSSNSTHLTLCNWIHRTSSVQSRRRRSSGSVVVLHSFNTHSRIPSKTQEKTREEKREREDISSHRKHGHCRIALPTCNACSRISSLVVCSPVLGRIHRTFKHRCCLFRPLLDFNNTRPRSYPARRRTVCIQIQESSSTWCELDYSSHWEIRRWAFPHFFTAF